MNLEQLKALLKQLQESKAEKSIIAEVEKQIAALEAAETVEMSDEAMKALTESVVKGLQSSVDEIVKNAVEKQLEKIETVEKKNVAVHVSDMSADLNKEAKELRFTKAIKALTQGDMEKVSKYNKISLELREKSGYGNVTTDADGGYTVEPEFEMEVEKLLPVYGVAAREATIIPVNGKTVSSNLLDTDIEFAEVNTEAGNVTGKKLVIDQATVSLRKFMANAPYTSEIEEDSAVNFYNELVQAFGRAEAKKLDQLLFTDNHASYPGIFEKSGIITETVGATVDLITWDDLLNAEFGVPTEAMANGKHYMHRSIWNYLTQQKDSEGRYQLIPTGKFITPWGTPVVPCDVMPAYNAIGSNAPIGVYGDLKRARIYRKRGLTIDQLREGTINDADGSSLNLALQDVKALRGRLRAVVMLKFPEAFDVYGTGSVS